MRGRGAISNSSDPKVPGGRTQHGEQPRTGAVPRIWGRAACGILLPLPSEAGVPPQEQKWNRYATINMHNMSYIVHI